jgi:hypothetical protein
LNFSGLFKPAFQIFCIDLFRQCVADLPGFETPFLLQAFLIKRLTTPEQQADAIFQFTVSDNWISIQKPDRMCMPYFVFCLWQVGTDLCGKQVADFFVAG